MVAKDQLKSDIGNALCMLKLTNPGFFLLFSHGIPVRAS